MLEQTMNLGYGPLGASGSGSIIQDRSDHGAPKESMKPLWKRVYKFL